MTDQTEKATMHGPISPDEAGILAADDIDPSQTGPILARIGAENAGPNAAAVVMKVDSGGREVPSHYASLDPRDLGTTIRTPRALEKGLPSLEEAHRSLTDTQQARVEAADPKGPAQI